MSRTMPPLNALRAFEAAGRLLSISKAAEELYVTPGAVSRQIKTLEDWLGHKLFIRSHRRITLTPFAKTYLPTITDALTQIHTATAEALGRQAEAPLRVCSYPTFTQRWLIPKWTEFYQRHPKIAVQFVTSVEPVDPQENDYDAAICVGNAETEWPNCKHILLFDIEAIVVCSPGLVERNGDRLTVKDLGRFPLLRSAPRPDDWKHWLRDVSADPAIDPNAGPIFENANLAIQAALTGIGLLVADRILVSEELESGRLVEPISHRRATRHSFYLVIPHTHTRDVRLKALTEWIKAEAIDAQILGMPIA